MTTVLNLLPYLFVYMAGGCMGFIAAALLRLGAETPAEEVEEDDSWRYQPRPAASSPEDAPVLPLHPDSPVPGMLGLVMAILLGSFLVPGEARAQDAGGAPAAALAAGAAPGGDPAGVEENAAQYCRSIADALSDARFARQKAALSAMEKDIEERLAKLEAKRAEYEAWLTRREEFLKRADGAVIAVFSQMRPDAAAAQMSAMGDDPAAAILAKLSPRVASAILNEMDPARAARLTGTMVGIARRTPADGKSS
ncbi:MotE family protein [Ancylobacter lacus]|uniref:MotE family protein n=1 Tax=Ancylobacter lacus TaxID=2579970 RepID=UPI001FE7EEF2|nr:MotE family protein [Ancylobacter lacus]